MKKIRPKIVKRGIGTYGLRSDAFIFLEKVVFYLRFVYFEIT